MKTTKSDPVARSQLIRIILGLVGLGIVYLVFALWGSDLLSKVSTLLIDFLLCMGGLIFWMFFFSQFILPVRKKQDRMMVAERLFDYMMGYHGPVVFIESGVVRERKKENQRKGPGLIWLDTASAALLRSSTRFTRAVGPGIVFTDKKETIAGTLDLHIQSCNIGPKDGEDVFIARLKRESKDDFNERQQRRFATQAITRDSHEIIPNISVSYRLDARDGEGGTQFGYRAVSVEKAISGRPNDASETTDSRDKDTNWQELPAHLAANVWRETLAKFTLNELFETSIENAGTTALQKIIRHVNDRLQNEFVDRLDDYGKPVYQTDELGNPVIAPDGKPIILQDISREFRILKSRGLRVTSVNISNLRFQPKVEGELLANWRTSWLDRARRERDLVERRRNYASVEGRRAAEIDFAVGVSNGLNNYSADDNLEGKEILKALIQGNILLCQEDPQFLSLTMQDVNDLRELLEWLEKEADQA